MFWIAKTCIKSIASTYKFEIILLILINYFSCNKIKIKQHFHPANTFCLFWIIQVSIMALTMQTCHKYVFLRPDFDLPVTLGDSLDPVAPSPPRYDLCWPQYGGVSDDVCYERWGRRHHDEAASWHPPRHQMQHDGQLCHRLCPGNDDTI